MTLTVRDSTTNCNESWLLTHNRIYILPSRYGLAFLALLLVLLGGSINYNNNLGFILTFLLGSLILTEFFHVYKNLAGLKLNIVPGQPVFCGETANFVLNFENVTSEARKQICASYHDFSGNIRHAKTDIPARSHVSLKRQLPTNRRGYLAIPRVTIATQFPLGFIRAWSNATSARKIVVFPAPLGIAALPETISDAVEIGTKGISGNEDFSGLRGYIRGDSPASIHWKTEAKTGSTRVKLFSGACPPRIRLSLADCPDSNLETQLSQLTLWVLEAEKQKIPYALSLPNKEYETYSFGFEHYHNCLQDLALFKIEHG